jgi:hypothetical protein
LEQVGSNYMLFLEKIDDVFETVTQLAHHRRWLEKEAESDAQYYANVMQRG